MYHRVRRRNIYIVVGGILLLSISSFAFPKSTENVKQYASSRVGDESLDSNIIDFDEQYSIKFDKKYGVSEGVQNKFNKEFNKYTVDDDNKDKQSKGTKNKNQSKLNGTQHNKTQSASTYKTIGNTFETTPTVDYSVIPLELLSTTENILLTIVDSTTEDLTVIPLSTTKKVAPNIRVEQTVTLPTSTQTVNEIPDELTEIPELDQVTDSIEIVPNVNVTTERTIEDISNHSRKLLDESESKNASLYFNNNNNTKTEKYKENIQIPESGKSGVPIFTELDLEDHTEAPEDYYDSVDVIPTKAPSTDAVSVLFGLAGSVVGSVVESVAERVVPKGIFDLFKRMQRQNEALEAEKLRSKEENGGLGQFGRGILKSISSGLGKPLSQLMAGVRDIGSLDNDRSFVNSLASGVTSVADYANSLADAFKDRVQAIYPGTVWCGDGRSQTARSSDLGLFFFTDTCCRQHDACKLYILAGETKFGLTNTGIFTRSHCSCDAKFRECLRRTNSLVSSQIGLTYFNVLGPQCFRRAHPIVRCIRRTRITGQKCEEYELDYTKPKMWQWFDSETF